MSLSAEDKKKLSRFLTSPLMRGQVQVSANRGGFKNFMITQTQADAIIINIDNKIALETLMMEIQALNKNKKDNERIILRVAAGGRPNDPHSASYSATPCVGADIVVHLTGHDFTNIVRKKDSNIVRVGASVQIGELDKTLYDKHQLSLPTSSLIPYVTAGGLSAAGGHGTGRDQPSFAGLIRGMTLILENGKEVYIDNTYPDFATIVGAHNGLFGVVVNMDIECKPAEKIECVMEKRSPIEFINSVKKGLFDHDDYVSAMYVPTYSANGSIDRDAKTVIIIRARPAPLNTLDVRHDALLSDLSQAAEMKLNSTFKVADILRAYPNIIPFYMRHITAPIAIGKKDQHSVGPWNEMMHYQTAYPHDLDEICGIFPVKDETGQAIKGEKIVEAFEHALNLLDEHAKKGEYPVTYGLYFRYLQGTNGGLSFTAHPEGHHVCAMDITTIKNAPGFAEFKKNMQDFFVMNSHAKFHWGKNAPTDINYSELYGSAWDDTKRALETWHKLHHISIAKSALLNPMFSATLGYPATSLIDTDQAAVSFTADHHVIAVQAKKLMTEIGDHSAEAQKIHAIINKDIEKKALAMHSTFKDTRSSPAQPATNRIEKKVEPSFCAML